MRTMVVIALLLVIGAVASAQTMQRHYGPVARQTQQAPKVKKDPNCNNKFEKGNMSWMEHYHCYGK